MSRPVKWSVWPARLKACPCSCNKWVAFWLGLRMIALIVGYRIESWRHPEYFAGSSAPHESLVLPTLDLRLEDELDDEEKER